jgi:hypothetical protein
MNTLISKLNELKGANIPIFVTGDSNIDFRKDRVVKNSMFPYYRLGAIGFRSNWDVLSTSPASDQLREQQAMVQSSLTTSTSGSVAIQKPMPNGFHPTSTVQTTTSSQQTSPSLASHTKNRDSPGFLYVTTGFILSHQVQCA